MQGTYENKGSVSTQYYVNTTLYLKAADPSFGSRYQIAKELTGTGPVSLEGGKVWKLAKITIPPSYPKGKAYSPAKKGSKTKSKAVKGA
jgi:hypothetical protein